MQPHKSVTEKISDFANYHLQARNSEAVKKQIKGKSLSVPLNNNNVNTPSTSNGEYIERKQALCRTTSNVLNSMPSQPQHLMPPNLQPYRLASGPQALSATTSPTSNPMSQQQHQQHFLKSQSIDNLEMYQSPNYNHNNTWSQSQPTDNLNQHAAQMDPQDMSLNLHKKLQRQLTLNPFDPRMNPMQHYHQNVSLQTSKGSQHLDNFQLSSPHKTLSTSHSLTGAQGQNQTHLSCEHQVRYIHYLQ